jgi:ABC-type Co2+ transport system permease subunit
MLITYLPLMLAEAAITAFAVAFLKRVKPEMLSGAEVGAT